MKFTDMNFDCLEAVLEYLKLIDLLNVADSTKRLNKAAELVFARKHGKKTVRIDAIPISRNRAFFITDKYIYIEDLKTALQLLRCFGAAVTKINFLETDDGNLHEMSVKIVTYINKYCADYLEELHIYRHSSERSDLFNYINRPFPKLTKFYNMGLEFFENSSLNRLFPNMRCLHNTFVFNSSFFDINTKHFPYLEKLSIFKDPHRESFLRNEMVIKLLQLNPQLKDLTILSIGENCILNTDLIRSAVDSLQNVERLSLRLKPITFLDDSDNIIQMKNVKLFIISFDDSDYWSYFPFSFENLEKFRIVFSAAQFVNGSFIDKFFNFIDKHSSITNLTIHGIERFGDVDWSRLAKSLPLLLEIDISTLCCYISADEAIEIMTKFKMLKKFRFELRDDYDNFRKRFGKNWEGTYKSDNKCVKLHRKT